MTSQYLLASHVYLCVTDDHVVLLDLKRDKYVGVGRAEMRALQEHVKGWPSLQGTTENGAAKSGSRSESLLSKMLASGMLTTDLARGKEALPISLPRPESALSEPELVPGRELFDQRPDIGPVHVLNFVRACSAARLSLRFRSISSVVARAAARKARCARLQPALNLRWARYIVAAYVHLRPLLFTAKDACLFDSLALTNYLARYGMFATWVFGVQTGPFAAHCWVQHEGVVLNDTPEHVRRYTPILAV